MTNSKMVPKTPVMYTSGVHHSVSVPTRSVSKGHSRPHFHSFHPLRQLWGVGVGFTCPNHAGVGSPQHRFAPVAPEIRLSADCGKPAADLQLVQGAAGGEVDAEAGGADNVILWGGNR